MGNAPRPHGNRRHVLFGSLATCLYVSAVTGGKHSETLFLTFSVCDGVILLFLQFQPSYSWTTQCEVHLCKMHMEMQVGQYFVHFISFQTVK